MEVLSTNRESATIQLTRKELSILANAINESQEAIEEWEFSTRMGAEPAEAEQLRVKLRALLAAIKDP
jgi:predicted negative regulator of RcsB-dependent stress response